MQFVVLWNKLQGFHHYGQEVSNFRRNIDYKKFEFQNDGYEDVSILLTQYDTQKRESFIIPKRSTIILGLDLDSNVSIQVKSVIGKVLSNTKFLNQHLSLVVVKPSVVGWSIIFYKKAMLKA